MKKLVSMLLALSVMGILTAGVVSDAAAHSKNACVSIENKINAVGNKIEATINKIEAARHQLQVVPRDTPAWRKAVNRLRSASRDIRVLRREQLRLRFELRNCSRHTH